MAECSGHDCVRCLVSWSTAVAWCPGEYPAQPRQLELSSLLNHLWCFCLRCSTATAEISEQTRTTHPRAARTALQSRLVLRRFLVEATSVLEQHLEMEGIFRKSGSVARQKELKVCVSVCVCGGEVQACSERRRWRAGGCRVGRSGVDERGMKLKIGVLGGCVFSVGWGNDGSRIGK